MSTAATHFRSTRPTSTQSGVRRGSAPFLLVVASLLGLMIVGFRQAELEQLPLRLVAVLILAVAVLLGTLIVKASHQGFWSLAFLLYLALTLFHLGLYVRPALLGEKTIKLSLLSYASVWYTDAAMVRAGVVVLLALLAYGLGVGVRTWTQEVSKAGDEQEAGADGRSLSGVADVGALAVLLGVAGWLVLSLTVVGRTFFLNGYLSFLSATATYPFSFCYLLISVGSTLCALRPRRTLVRMAIGAFVLFAILALMIGIRGEVLIPLTAAAAVFARNPAHQPVLERLRRPAARLVVILALIGVLLGISIVQQVRVAGVQALGGSTVVEASPLQAVDEMGYSIRVVITTLAWHEDLREPYRLGDTYYAPPLRVLARVTGAERREAAQDYQLMNVEIADRVGSIGGSMIAEAQHNFGRLGAVVVLTLVGAAAAGVIPHRRSAWGQAILGLIGLLALMHVRNSFAPLFVWGSAGLVLVLCGLVLSKFYPRDFP